MQPHEIYRDREGRQFRLVTRVDPMGDVAPYWQVFHMATGRTSTIREDRLTSDYIKMGD